MTHADRVVDVHPSHPYITEGAIITAYGAGYHRVVKLLLRNGTNELVHYQRVLTATGKALSNKPQTCHISYCKLVDADAIFDEEVQAATAKRDFLKGLTNGSAT